MPFLPLPLPVLTDSVTTLKKIARYYRNRSRSHRYSRYFSFITVTRTVSVTVKTVLYRYRDCRYRDYRYRYYRYRYYRYRYLPMPIVTVTVYYVITVTILLPLPHLVPLLR